MTDSVKLKHLNVTVYVASANTVFVQGKHRQIGYNPV